MTRSTNFSPNSVLGSRRALTLLGISPTMLGVSARSTVAFAPLELTLRTSPTIRPRSFTSAGGASWLPTWSVSQRDVHDVDEDLVVDRDRQADQQGDHEKEDDAVDAQEDALADLPVSAGRS